MGTTVGSIILIMYKLLVAAAVISAASCEAEAEAGYLGYAPALYNAYPNWPGVSTPYSSSTCYGCRPYYGKREAEAEPDTCTLPTTTEPTLTPTATDTVLLEWLDTQELPPPSLPGHPQGLRGKRSA